jgi:hypothetical protein
MEAKVFLASWPAGGKGSGQDELLAACYVTTLKIQGHVEDIGPDRIVVGFSSVHTYWDGPEWSLSTRGLR